MDPATKVTLPGWESLHILWPSILRTIESTTPVSAIPGSMEMCSTIRCCIYRPKNDKLRRKIGSSATMSPKTLLRSLCQIVSKQHPCPLGHLLLRPSLFNWLQDTVIGSRWRQRGRHLLTGDQHTNTCRRGYWNAKLLGHHTTYFQKHCRSHFPMILLKR